jgi:hypothetical protein
VLLSSLFCNDIALANKEYFITTSVIWGLDDYVKQGGYLMLKVKPESNETLEVILN